jgi:hypothetical protein
MGLTHYNTDLRDSIDDEIPVTAKSAEDRKAQAALSSLDTREDDAPATKDVDQEAVRNALDRLTVSGTTNGIVTKKEDETKVKKTNYKLDPTDVALLVRGLQKKNFVKHPPTTRSAILGLLLPCSHSIFLSQRWLGRGRHHQRGRMLRSWACPSCTSANLISH